LKSALEKLGKWTVEVIKRSGAAKGFSVLPRRWVVERTLAWLNRNCRLAKDFKASIESDFYRRRAIPAALQALPSSLSTNEHIYRPKQDNEVRSQR
jgi:transposase